MTLLWSVLVDHIHIAFTLSCSCYKQAILKLEAVVRLRRVVHKSRAHRSRYWDAAQDTQARVLRCVGLWL